MFKGSSRRKLGSSLSSPAIFGLAGGESVKIGKLLSPRNAASGVLGPDGFRRNSEPDDTPTDFVLVDELAATSPSEEFLRISGLAWLDKDLTQVSPDIQSFKSFQSQRQLYSGGMATNMARS